MQAKQDDIIIIGRLGAAHGVQGWMKLHSFTQPKENIFSYHPWLIQINSRWETVNNITSRQQGSGFIVKLPKLVNRDQAQEYTNTDIAINRAQLPELGENEFYWSDLQGLTAINESGIILGTVDHLIETGANDVLVIKGKKEHLIPYLLGQFVKKVDLLEKTIHVDWDPEF